MCMDYCWKDNELPVVYSNESNFHSFYYLWEGCSDAHTRKALYLDIIENPSRTLTPLKKAEEKVPVTWTFAQLYIISAVLNLGT